MPSALLWFKLHKLGIFSVFTDASNEFIIFLAIEISFNMSYAPMEEQPEGMYWEGKNLCSDIICDSRVSYTQLIVEYNH